jgi:signal transduction histidine kinase
MPELLRKLFSSDGFMPHGHCYLWKPGLVWLHVVSDGLTALAYTSIPFTLVYLARRRKDVPYNWLFFCFGMFIIACGATHAMEIWTLWTPLYWLSGGIKAVTAAASVSTAILLIRVVPKALAIPTAQELSNAHEKLRRANEQLEGLVRDRNEELGQKNAAIEEQQRKEEQLRHAKETAEAAIRELEAFSYSVAHDLRAPLRAINGFSAALVEDLGPKLEPEARDYLQSIEAGASRMGQLIDALLSLSRVSRTELTREDTNLSELASSVAQQLRATDPRRAVEFVVQPDLRATGDQRLLRALLDNLLGNAWKFTSRVDRARIEFGKASVAGISTYFVRDNGAGFDMAYGEKLFAPFQRLHSASDFPGNGIGLATVQRIVGRHGGKIWAEGAVNGGATFHFTLDAPNRGSP